MPGQAQRALEHFPGFLGHGPCGTADAMALKWSISEEDGEKVVLNVAEGFEK